MGGHARDPERLRQLPHFLEVSERYKSVPSKTAENAEGVITFRRLTRKGKSVNPTVKAIPKTAYCRYEWTHMLDVHDAWRNEMMATHCDHPVVQGSETSSETPFMQPLRRPPSMLEHPAASEYRTNERLWERAGRIAAFTARRKSKMPQQGPR